MICCTCDTVPPLDLYASEIAPLISLKACKREPYRSQAIEVSLPVPPQWGLTHFQLADMEGIAIKFVDEDEDHQVSYAHGGMTEAFDRSVIAISTTRCIHRNATSRVSTSWLIKSNWLYSVVWSAETCCCWRCLDFIAAPPPDLSRLP